MPSAGSKDSVLVAVSIGPSFNYTSHKKDAVAGYSLFQVIDNAVSTAEHTSFNGQPAYLLDKTTQPTCMGDEAGIGGGVKSGTVGGEVKPTSGSSTIFIEGKALIREGDTCTMNNGNVQGVYVTVDASWVYDKLASLKKEEAVLFAGPGGGILSGIGPSNQDISDFTGISRDKIDAVGNTAAGFNQMWTFGVSDVLFGAPDPNKASTKAGQVAGMAVGTYTGSSTYSAAKAAQATRAAQVQRSAIIAKAAQRNADNAKAYNNYVGYGDSVVVRTTQQGDKAMRVTKGNGNVVDISRSRVKEYIPNNHPKAPPGVMQKRKFPESLPGSKGYKRLPTDQEKKALEHAVK